MDEMHLLQAHRGGGRMKAKSIEWCFLLGSTRFKCREYAGWKRVGMEEGSRLYSEDSYVRAKECLTTYGRRCILQCCDARVEGKIAITSSTFSPPRLSLVTTSAHFS